MIWLREIFVLPIRLYRWVGSPLKNVLLGNAGRCRFHPTCSAYALESILRFGCWRGSWLALCRICRCHPWGGAGHDPVPPLQPPTKSFPNTSNEADAARKDSPSALTGLAIGVCLFA